MKYFLFIVTTLFLFNCSSIQQNTSNQNDLFNQFKQRFILALWQQYPSWASSQGFHDYDSVLVVPNESSRNLELLFCKNYLDSLNVYKIDSLNANNNTDYQLIKAQLLATQFYINDFKSFTWNPSDYNVSGTFAEMLANNYDSLDTRLQNFYIRMKYIPDVYAAAKKYIKNPTLEHTQLAINQNLGGLSTFDADLKDALAKSHLDEIQKQKITERAKSSTNAINDYVNWLKQLNNATPRSFRLGKELYDKKFEHDIQSSYSAIEIYNKALIHKANLHAKMFDITKELWPKYFKQKLMPNDTLVAIKQLIDIISLKHIPADSFQLEIEQQIPKLIAFIKQKDLIYIDPSKPLVVRKEPAYMAGVAGASISSPGPYDKNGNTYYNVGSFAGWEKSQIESYLREYNYYILQILNIHEAIPGHYTQLVYSNQSPSIIKAILANGAMIEGWAVYTEKMMLENGYGSNPSTDSSEPEKEMWLMYYKWNLRSTCNTILDYGVHVNNLNKVDAMNLLVNQAFQQSAEAEGKWKRVSVTQVQLCSYYTGFTEIYDFREELKQKQNGKFNLKQFHEQFLSYGSVPVKYIKELMRK